MPLPFTPSQLHQQIRSDIEACETLLSLLDKEQEALKKRDPDALATIVESKIPPLAHLEQSAKTRAMWLTSAGKEATSETWNALLERSQQKVLQEEWKKLKALTMDCKAKNEVNGKLLIRSQQVFSRLVELLRGQQTRTGLYNASGSATRGGSSHVFGEA